MLIQPSQMTMRPLMIIQIVTSDANESSLMMMIMMIMMMMMMIKDTLC